MKVLEKIHAYGHKNITCSHNTTIEITKDKSLTERGTCILGINADKGCAELDPFLKNKIWKNEKIEVFIKAGELYDHFYGYGNKDLPLTNKNEMVFRKSNFICERTILINCSKSAIDISREIISKISNSGERFEILLKTPN